MWSSIGRATARQVRVGGGLSIRTARRIAAQLAPRAAPIVPSGIRIAAVFARGFAEAGRPKKTATSTASKTKKSSAKNTGEKKTATKKTGTKKAAKAKRPAAKKAKKVKKVLTEEQKTNRRIRELKKTALLREEPTSLPSTSWTVFVTEQLKEGSETIATAMPRISIAYKSLSDSEMQKYDAQAAQNKVASDVNHKNWIESHTVQEIHEANKARMLLRRKYNLSIKTTLDDPRYPKQALTAWTVYIKSRSSSPDITSEPAKAKFSKLSAEWKQMSAEERKPFEEMAAIDAARFKNEMDEYRSGQ